MTDHDLIFTPSTAVLDTREYELDGYSAWQGDPVSSMDATNLVALMESPHWQDRVRAAELMRRIKPTLPDQFPVIYERADSPSNNRDGVPNPHAREFHWVKHPIIGVLHDTLAQYQAIWDAYTDQWGPGSRRLFAVGLRDQVSPYRVFRPEATTQDVLSGAFLTHRDMIGLQSVEVKAAHQAWINEARKGVRR